MIEIGTLKQWPTALGAADAAFEMRYLAESDLPQIMALQAVIIDRLSQKDLLEAFSRPFMRAISLPKGSSSVFSCKTGSSPFVTSISRMWTTANGTWGMTSDWNPPMR